MSNEAVRFYPLDQWQRMADPAPTRYDPADDPTMAGYL
jgi:hypothetical protein